jgi:Ca-activated chloride channel family protein
MTRSLAVLGVSVTLASALLSGAPQPAQASRTVYVTVTDKNGQPVTDLTADEFAVKEGGKTAQLVQAAPATEPMQIALIVDDNGTGLFRAGLSRFIQRMDGHAAMAIRSVVGQTMKVVDFTTSIEALNKGLSTLNARPGTPDGGQLLEGIAEAAIELRQREARRPVIVALTVGGEEHSTANGDHVLDQLRNSGASLHVFSVISSALRSTVATQRPSALLQENLSLQKVLGDGPRQSGGRHMEIAPTAGSLVELQNLASELLQQYQVSYTLPAGARPSDRIAISIKRRGVSVRAPTRVRN